MDDYGLVDTCNRRIDYEKDPDDTRDYPQNFVIDLDGDTIDDVTFLLPDGLTSVSSSNTTTTATIFVSGGSAGSIYRITCRVETAGGRTFDRTVRVRVRER